MQDNFQNELFYIIIYLFRANKCISLIYKIRNLIKSLFCFISINNNIQKIY